MDKEKPKKKKQKQRELEDQQDEETEANDEKPKFHLVEELIELGINKGDLDKLKESGFTTIESINFATKKQLVEIKGLSDVKVEKILKAVSQVLPLQLLPSKHALNKRRNLIRLSTGSRNLDNLLQGGVETYNMTELFGEFRTGKSQLCHTLCVTCQLPLSEGGGEGKAIFIDTEGTFRPEKLEPIARRFDLDPDEVIKNVSYGRAYNFEQQIGLLAKAAALMSEHKNYSLLIIDSATHLFRTEFIGRGELAARQNHLAKFLRACQKLADEFGIAVVMTNQVVAQVDGMGFGGNDKKPIGGNIMAHAVQTRLYLRKGAKENRICKIYDSPNLPESEAGYSISEEGIKDSTN